MSSLQIPALRPSPVLACPSMAPHKPRPSLCLTYSNSTFWAPPALTDTSKTLIGSRVHLSSAVHTRHWPFLPGDARPPTTDPLTDPLVLRILCNPRRAQDAISPARSIPTVTLLPTWALAYARPRSDPSRHSRAAPPFVRRETCTLGDVPGPVCSPRSCPSTDNVTAQLDTQGPLLQTPSRKWLLYPRSQISITNSLAARIVRLRSKSSKRNRVHGCLARTAEGRVGG